MRVSHLTEMECFKLILVFSLILFPEPVPAWRIDTVKGWARTLSDELWQLSEILTKSSQIRAKYKQMNASVKQKDGRQILESALESVSTMLTRKINAVKCIHATAEQLARDFNYSLIDNSTFSDNLRYCSAKYSVFKYENNTNSSTEKIPKFAQDNPHYMFVELEKDSHFYDISITNKTSCVQVPTNIYYKEPDALNAILWSKDLNEIFIKNYNTDPSLAWQYFGSSRGIFRFYPGMPWKRGVDTYDCRVRSWYIEAATCSKDVIILFDVSGSMTGFKNYVARRTLNSILDTLSNNDYVNVLAFKNLTSNVVDCFEDLVQATPENVATLKLALTPDKDNVHKIPLEGNANLGEAYMKAFETLKRKRTKCDVSSNQGCNQMVMLITDYVPGNLTEVFEQYNRETVDGQVYTPVRVFTYLIGKEVTNVEEIQWMACLNRGYYVHIHSVEEVQQQVLKYINVIARPMILDGSKPPPTWTHANIDDTRTNSWDVSKDVNKPDEDKLVTSVAIPAFDFKYNEEHNDSILLGVAGTDVPIDSIAKLAQPHQLGVNGYSFIVSNNGYLLLHPLLITSINGKLQLNYNSVDFVEVEQFDDGKGARDLGSEIKRLRQQLVDGVEDSEKDLPVLFHYDNMRRLARVKHDYFFNKLEGTPFSMGISLPKGYGDTELLLKDNPLEAKQGQELTGINVTDYFRFSYRLHPDWVYCKFHYLEGHETENAEIEMWNFLANISKNSIDITKVQYNASMHSIPFDVSTHCGNATAELGKDEYYCNEDLVKQLVFDAKLSTPYFKEWLASNYERAIAEKYNISVRFIATGSGLTRWHYIYDEDKNEKVDDYGVRHKNYTGPVFGDLYYNAIEETWYKAAVLQHMISKESIVISTPLPILDDTVQNRPPIQNDDGDITITASYAIFYKDGDSETPASVVGFQFSYLSFFDRFMDIVKPNSNRQHINEDVQCDGVEFDCFIIDSSGYVALSLEISNVGTFFGTLAPGVMQSFIDKDIFDHVDVFNYQALCPVDMIPPPKSSWSLITPFTLVKNLIQWTLMEGFLMLFSFMDSSNQYADGAAVGDDDEGDFFVADEEEPTTTAVPPQVTPPPSAKKEDMQYFSCDRRITLYILNQTYFLEDLSISPVVYEDEPTDCVPAYWAAYMSKTNLMLVVVQKEHWVRGEKCQKPPSTTPEATPQSTTSREPCHKLDLANLPRRRLEGCFTYHEKESNITACGRGSRISAEIATFAAASVVFITLLLS